MNTPSHLILTAATRKALWRVRIVNSAVLLGAVAPDLPLIVLSVGGMLYYRGVLGWNRQATLAHLFTNLYFHDPFWICAHSLLHAPLILVGGLVATGMLKRRAPAAAEWWQWFLIACLFHAVVDVFTHHDDGPLLLFPFDWSYRFHSPVSYWDSRHYGLQFTIFELATDTILLMYLALPWARRVFMALARTLPARSRRAEPE
ncbi:MAG: metal-dependent hydrolase [Candidatus Binatia bacterium]